MVEHLWLTSKVVYSICMYFNQSEADDYLYKI